MGNTGHWKDFTASWPLIQTVLLALAISLFINFLVVRRRSKGRTSPSPWRDRFFTAEGYVRIILPTGRSKFLHREIAEDILERRLEKWEVVHHINGRPHDNRPENLCVMGARDHDRYHEWYDWIFMTYGKYPTRDTQLKKLTEDFNGTLLSDLIDTKIRKF